MENEEKQPQEAETPESEPQKEEEIDWKAEALKHKAIAERRAKKLEELKSSLEEKKETKEPNKPNTEGLSREEAIFFAKGFEEDDLKLASTIAKMNGISLLEATKDEYFKAVQDKKQQKSEDKKASLPPSNATGFTPSKPLKDMTTEEHKAFYEAQIRKVLNG
jgi:hypothetical protein